MIKRFYNRVEAGRILAEKLSGYADRPDVLVLGLPRGGVPVAAEVAKALNAPLDILLVRKLGVPGNEELAMGAIAAGGIRIVNAEVADSMRIADDVMDKVAAREQRELERREQAYRGNLPPPDVHGKTIIVIDDGVATGSTMLAAVAALRILNAGRIIAAVPTIAAATMREIRNAADEIVAVIVPEDFRGVGEWYDDFSQTTDDDVRQILAQAPARSRCDNL